MNIFYILILTTLIALLLIFHKHISLGAIITLLCSIFILIIVIKPDLCIEATLLGAKLFFYKVFPSLFPFLVISSLIVSCNGIHIYSKAFGNLLCKPLKLPKQCSLAIIISMLCGYPMGAKYCCELYKNKYIDLNTCQRLLNIASNSSPLFLIGAVGTSMLSSSKLGYLLLITNCLSCVIMAILLPSKEFRNIPNNNAKKPIDNMGSILKNAIDDSIKTSLSIGGFVIFFSVLNSFIKSNTLVDIAFYKISMIFNISKELLQGLFLGLIEMTNGCYLICTTSTNMYYKIAIISFLVSFSGLSIITQVYSFTYKFNLSMKKYVFRKFIQGLICSLLSVIGYYLLSLKPNIQIFNYGYKNLSYSLTTIIFVLLILPLSIYATKKLFNIS